MNIINAIKRIKNSKRVLFTTPSHSQGAVTSSVLKNLLGFKAFNADMSEVDGLDNLRKPNGCIKLSQQKAAQIYGTQSSFYLVNGSSSGIIALMMSVLSANDKVLIARNTHESVYNGLVLTGAKPIWFLPKWNDEFDIAMGITVDDVEQQYRANPDTKALIITSPTYEGIVSDVKVIGEFCKEKGIIFIVDEAHGALFPFSDKLPASAINLGADAVVHSLHKNASALTGCAILHITKNSCISTDVVQKNLNLINSTSPSWLLIASIEGTIEFLNTKRGKDKIDELLENLQALISKHDEFEFFISENHDITKLLFKKKGFTGELLSEFLSNNNIEDELVTQKAVLCLTGIGTTGKKLKKLSKVLTKFSKKNCMEKVSIQKVSIPEQILIPKQAHFAEFELIKSKSAVGRIIAENITPYPPCIPILMAGEKIEQSHLKFLDENVKVVKK